MGSGLPVAASVSQYGFCISPQFGTKVKLFFLYSARAGGAEVLRIAIASAMAESARIGITALR